MDDRRHERLLLLGRRAVHDSQYVAYANPASAIIASVNLVSSRQMLYGTSLAHFCKDAGSWLTFLFGATVTDESFGVNLGRFSTNPTWSVRDALLVNLFSQASWTLANMLGALIGTALSIPTAMASFAMTALFICLLCMQKLTRANVVAAIMAAAGVIICKVTGLTGPAITAYGCGLRRCFWNHL